MKHCSFMILSLFVFPGYGMMDDQPGSSKYDLKIINAIPAHNQAIVAENWSAFVMRWKTNHFDQLNDNDKRNLTFKLTEQVYAQLIIKKNLYQQGRIDKNQAIYGQSKQLQEYTGETINYYVAYREIMKPIEAQLHNDLNFDQAIEMSKQVIQTIKGSTFKSLTLSLFPKFMPQN